MKAPPVPGSSECFGPHAGRPLPLRKPAHAGENLNLGCEGPRLDLLPGLLDASKGPHGVHVLKLPKLSKLCRYCRNCRNGRNGRYCRNSVETVETVETADTVDTADTVERSHGRNCHTKRKNGHRCMSPGVGLVAQLVMGLVVPSLSWGWLSPDLSYPSYLFQRLCALTIDPLSLLHPASSGRMAHSVLTRLQAAS